MIVSKEGYFIKSKSKLSVGLTLGMIGTGVLIVNHFKKSRHLEKINLQLAHAKDSFHPQDICGSWIMKREKTNNYVGAINVLKNDEVIDYCFQIDGNYNFKWIPRQEDY